MLRKILATPSLLASKRQLAALSPGGLNSAALNEIFTAAAVTAFRLVAAWRIGYRRLIPSD
jgi:hypothetical protein